jgi:hypothetical protein
MKKIRLTESDLTTIIKSVIIEAEKTKCQTPDSIYNISISDDEVSANIKLPKKLDLNKTDAKILETNLHNVIEIVLSKYFYKKN